MTDDRPTENRAGEQTPISQARKRMPNQPAQVLRAPLVRGQCTCAAGRRLLQEIEP
jgi:hypothetical protein